MFSEQKDKACGQACEEPLTRVSARLAYSYNMNRLLILQKSSLYSLAMIFIL